MRRGLRVATLTVVVGLIVAPAAPASTIVAHPGSGALAAAVSAAAPGDRLELDGGTYGGPVVVDKPLTIVGDRGGPRPLIDGGCAARVTILVTSDGVSLRWLKVIGADKSAGGFPSEVDLSEVAGGSARELKLVDTCDAEYGINVFHTGAMRLRDNEAIGFDDAGIYVGAIQDTGSGSIAVTGNSAHGNNRGLIVEDSGGLASIVVRNNDFDRNRLIGEANPEGIFVANSNGVMVKGNRARHNGKYGIQIDAASHDNRLFGNLFAHNGLADALDEGTANCGLDNLPESFAPCA